MKMALLGPPGAGKGSQTAILSEKLGIPAISTGDILRDAVHRGTPIGLNAKTFMDAGELVPDEVIIGIIIDRISRHDCAGGYILDGVPRTLVQAQALDEQGIDVDVVLSIEISDGEIVERLGGRRSCLSCSSVYHIIYKPPSVSDICDSCGATLITRKDDEKDTILNRLQAYHRDTAPLKDYYAALGKLKKVDNIQGIEETSAAVFKVLGVYD